VGAEVNINVGSRWKWISVWTFLCFVCWVCDVSSFHERMHSEWGVIRVYWLKGVWGIFLDWFFRETRLVVSPAAEPPTQGGLLVGCPPSKVLNTKICCGLFRTGFLSCDRRRYSGSLLRDVGVTSLIIIRPPPPLAGSRQGGGGGAVVTGYLRYLTRLNSDVCSARKSSRHSLRDLRKFTDECSARKCPCFSKGVVWIPWRSSARKRSNAVFRNVPAFSGEGSFDIFSTSVAVVIVPWLDLADPS